MAFRRMPSVALVALCSPVLAQNFNIDIGLSQNGPASTYAAAGLPGVWNSITAPHTMPPTPAGQITNGSTWNFQAWFRDPEAGGANFDLSNAMSVMFGH